MKNYAKRESFYLGTKQEKMNNKWIFCYYLNAFSLSHFLASRFLRLGKNSTSYEWIFSSCACFSPRMFFFLSSEFFFFFSFVFLVKRRKIVEGRLLLLDDSILFRLFMIKYSWCLVFVCGFFPLAKTILLFRLYVNFIQSTEKHS